MSEQVAAPAQQQIETIARIYEAFGRGDVPAILAELAEDVRWEAWRENAAQVAGVPWMTERSGRAEVPQFFAHLADTDIHAFEVHGLASGENTVIAEVEIDLTYRPTGERLHDEELHLWRFGADGQVTSFRHYTDTAKHIRAAGLG